MPSAHAIIAVHAVHGWQHLAMRTRTSRPPTRIGSLTRLAIVGELTAWSRFLACPPRARDTTGWKLFRRIAMTLRKACLDVCASLCVLLACAGLYACGDDEEDMSDAGTADTGVAGAGAAGVSGADDDAGAVAGSGAAGTAAAGTGAAGSGTAGTGTVPRPPSDGNQLSICMVGQDSGCADTLACYTAIGATGVGYCTTTCELDADCTSLGAGYSCSSPSGQSGDRFCRLTCTGEDDTSCPALMSCVDVNGAFRCLYDEKDLGAQDTPVFGACESDGDCTGELGCYEALIFGQGGTEYSGICAAPCENSDECTDMPSSGNITPSCGNGGLCILDCSTIQGPGPVPTDAGQPVCPDGMECANLGAGRGRCLPVAVTGGI
jgi:hypothetical protein